MKNSISPLKVIAIIVIVIIVALLALVIFDSLNKFVKERAKQNVLEAYKEFNDMWTDYEGKQSGTKLRALSKELVANLETNGQNAIMLPDLIYKPNESSEIITVNSTVKENNEDGFNEFKNDLNPRHTYFVKLVYSKKTNLVTGIIVQYNDDDKIKFYPDET